MIFIKYGKTVRGRFISRSNRFIAKVFAEGDIQTVHVKNTGRCRELLTEGAEVILECAPDTSKRRTKYDLTAVYKNGMLINMDSQSPNKAAAEFIPSLFENATLIRPETVYGNSRFDFYIEADGKRSFMEVKGVTLENDGVCLFPDAPTERGVKHLKELSRAAKEGFGAFVLFVIQMERAKYFTPNRETHPEFADALTESAKSGVKLLAYTCTVTENSMELRAPCPIVLDKSE